MPRNLVLCSDGTGNTANKDRGTNVWRLYESLDRHSQLRGGPEQLATHDDGVGTSTNKTLAALGGAFGFGLARNVRELYTWLARNYRPGDKIWLFGFSRGAFTVRCLAGLICRCGVPNASALSEKELDEIVSAAWFAYKRAHSRRDASVADGIKRTHGAAATAETPNDHDVPIEFIGVWDTVDAYGLPFDELTEAVSRATQWLGPAAWVRFRDHKLHPLVRHGVHAIAIDDERRSFHPKIWNERDLPEEQTVDQAWFAGMHSDVGGGYPRGSLSLVSLDWMMGHAEARGLRFSKAAREEVCERMNPLGPMHDSRTGLGAYYRYGPREIATLCEAHGTVPRVHESVMERIERSPSDRVPEALPHAFEVVGRDTLARPHASHLAELRRMHGRQSKVYLGHLAWTFLLVAAIWLFGRTDVALPTPRWGFLAGLLESVASFLPDRVAGWVEALLREPFWTLLFAASFVYLRSLRHRFTGACRDLARAAWKGGESVGAGEQTAGWRGGVVAAIVIVAATGVAFRVADNEARAQTGPSSPDGGGRVIFDTGDPGFDTGIELVEGRQYRITVVTDEEWSDDDLAADPAGLENDPPAVLLPAAPFKRLLGANWFALLGSIGSCDDPFVLFEERSEGDSFERTIGPIEETGNLFLFVNDVTSYFTPQGPWFFYGNNRGTARVSVTALTTDE